MKPEPKTLTVTKKIKFCRLRGSKDRLDGYLVNSFLLVHIIGRKLPSPLQANSKTEIV